MASEVDALKLLAELIDAAAAACGSDIAAIERHVRGAIHALPHSTRTMLSDSLADFFRVQDGVNANIRRGDSAN